MITVRPTQLKDYAILMALTLTKEQLTFASSFDTLFANRKPEHLFWVIINDGIVENRGIIGFFMTDGAYAHRYTFARKKDLGLQNLIILSQYQGKGYAKEALIQMSNIVATELNDFDGLCVTVSKNNIAAYRSCINAGFEDNNMLYRDDDNLSPQHILRQTVLKNTTHP